LRDGIWPAMILQKMQFTSVMLFSLAFVFSVLRFAQGFFF